MTDIVPFRGLRFDPKRTKIARVLVPPYDVLRSQDYERYYERDPHNAIRLEPPYCPDVQADYGAVAETLLRWRSEGVLRLDDRPSYYVLRQRFKTPLGDVLERTGFIGALRLEEYKRGVVFPHERTLSGPKEDRLKLLRACRANLSCVFMLYEDRNERLKNVLMAPFESDQIQVGIDDEGTEHAVAQLNDRDSVDLVRGFMSERTLVIADGHHRYETALAYRDECRIENDWSDGPAVQRCFSEAPYERNLVYCANAHASGNLLLAIHRVIPRGADLSTTEWRRRLPDWEMYEVRIGNVGEIRRTLAQNLEPIRDRPAFVADDGSGILRIFSKPDSQELPIRLVHQDVLERTLGFSVEEVAGGAILFEKSEIVAARFVREARSAVALYLNPVTPEEVFQVTRRGEILPQKSTFFQPKVPAGLVFRSYEDVVWEGKYADGQT